MFLFIIDLSEEHRNRLEKAGFQVEAGRSLQMDVLPPGGSTLSVVYMETGDVFDLVSPPACRNCYSRMTLAGESEGWSRWFCSDCGTAVEVKWWPPDSTE